MTHFKLLCLIITISLSTSSLLSQVISIKENVRNDRQAPYSGSSYSTYSPNSYSPTTRNESFGSYLAGQILNGIVKGVGLVTVKAQRSVLDNKEQYPNLISFEIELDYGTSFSEQTFQPSVTGNWGIIGTDLRYSLLHDHTGSLNSLDWQVLILRIPVKTLKLNYGIGFTSLDEPRATYFESSTGFDLSLHQSKLNIMADYRWTAKRAEERYRQEFKFTADCQIYKKGMFSISPLVGVSYQDYFRQDSFWFINTGVKVRFSKY